MQLCIPRLCAAGKTGGAAFPKRLISTAPLRPCPSSACALRRLRQRTQINLLHSMSETIDHPGHVALHGGALFRRYRSESNNHVRVEQPAANAPQREKSTNDNHVRRKQFRREFRCDRLTSNMAPLCVSSDALPQTCPYESFYSTP